MMERKSTGLTSGDVPHPKIEAGDKWKDGRGSVVIIESYQFNRVTFIRQGYDSPCVQPIQRFLNEFHYLGEQSFQEWHQQNNPIEKLEKVKKFLFSGREENEKRA